MEHNPNGQLNSAGEGHGHDPAGAPALASHLLRSGADLFFACLPLNYNDQTPVEKPVVTQLQGEWNGYFGGLISFAPDKGWWLDLETGDVYEDRIQVMFAASTKGPEAEAFVAEWLVQAAALLGQAGGIFAFSLKAQICEPVTPEGYKQLPLLMVVDEEPAPANGPYDRD